VDVELLAPVGIPPRPVLQGWARHPDRRDGLPEGVLEKGRREALGWRGQTPHTAAPGRGVQPQDGVEVDRAPPLELGHLGIAHPHQPTQLPLLEAHQPARVRYSTMVVRRHSSGASVPQHLGPGVVAGGAQRLEGHLEELYGEVRTGRFSTIIVCRFDPDSRQVTSSERVTPLYRTDGRA
jgi:hypothetical protein